MDDSKLVPYCKFIDGDVYATVGVGDWSTDELEWKCYLCKLDPNLGHPRFVSLKEFRKHLEYHLARGHHVPSFAFARIDHELETGVVGGFTLRPSQIR